MLPHMSGDAIPTIAERSQMLAQQVARNIEARRRLLQAPTLGLVDNSERVWAIAREAAKQARARQLQARSGGTDVTA